MKYIIYLSTAHHLMDHDELLDILSVSRINNQQRAITGMLLYGEGVFMQVLEGEPSVVDQAFDVISKDERHKNIIKMADGELQQRNFPEWAMGFKSGSANELAEIGGYIDPSKPIILSNSDADAVISILQNFADLNRMSDNY